MTTSNKHPDAPWRNFYGRVRGKTLKASQETYLDEDLGRLSPGAVDWEENPERRPLDTGAMGAFQPEQLSRDEPAKLVCLLTPMAANDETAMPVDAKG